METACGPLRLFNVLWIFWILANFCKFLVGVILSNLERRRPQLSNDTKINNFEPILVHQIQNSYNVANFNYFFRLLGCLLWSCHLLPHPPVQIRLPREGRTQRLPAPLPRWHFWQARERKHDPGVTRILILANNCFWFWQFWILWFLPVFGEIAKF